MVWGSHAGGGKIFLEPPRTNLMPYQHPVQWVPVCFLDMKWSDCGTDHPSLLVLRSCIQRAIPLLPLCACLACNETAFTFIHIQIPYKQITIIRRRPLKICSVPQTAWSHTDMCNILLKLYTAFQCHTQNVCLFYSSTHPSQSPLYQSPHNKYPQISCSGLLTIPSPELVLSPFPYLKLTSIRQHLLNVGSQQLCKLFTVQYLTFIFSHK